MGHLNLSPSKIPIHKVATTSEASGRPNHQGQRPFVPGHRRAKSDGCGMFMMTAKKHEAVIQDHYKANYSHHLLDDSKLDEEPLSASRPGSPHTLPADLRCSLRKGNIINDKSTEGGVMKILRNPGIKCQHQVGLKLNFSLSIGFRDLLLGRGCVR